MNKIVKVEFNEEVYTFSPDGKVVEFMKNWNNGAGAEFEREYDVDAFQKKMIAARIAKFKKEGENGVVWSGVDALYNDIQLLVF